MSNLDVKMFSLGLFASTNREREIEGDISRDRGRCGSCGEGEEGHGGVDEQRNRHNGGFTFFRLQVSPFDLQ